MPPERLPNPQTYRGFLPMHLPRMVIAAGKSYPLETDRLWSSKIAGERRMIESGDKRAVAHGVIAYSDVFKQHWTTSFQWI